jgi:hypothetical protein
MGANQNSSPELDLYLKLDPMHLSFNSTMTTYTTRKIELFISQNNFHRCFLEPTEINFRRLEIADRNELNFHRPVMCRRKLR